MTTVNLALIATGPYARFIPSLIEQADKFLLRGCDVEYHIFSDQINQLQSSKDRWISWHPWSHGPWPHGTLYRYHAMLSNHEFWSCEYCYYMDVDMEIVAPVGKEILGEIVGVRHHGYVGKDRKQFPYERRIESMAYVPHNFGTTYYAGAFQGGAADRWREACIYMVDKINSDERRGITPLHNDESIWNRYMLIPQDPLILPPQYCWHPESPLRPYSKLDPSNPPRIIAMDKGELFEKEKSHAAQ